MKRILVAVPRLLARSMPVAGLRHLLLRLSRVQLGDGTFVNAGVTFVDNYRGDAIILGERVAVAPGVMFLADSDPNNSRLASNRSYIVRGTIRVLDDAWLGANCIILPNVVIGRCAIVGAGAVVTASVPDCDIVAGVPARRIGTTGAADLDGEP